MRRWRLRGLAGGPTHRPLRDSCVRNLAHRRAAPVRGGLGLGHGPPLVSVRCEYWLQAKDAFGVGVEHVMHHVLGVAQVVPLAQQPVERNAGMVGTEHDLALKAAPDVCP
jgi:hypothetical protein